jgi:hypothetical protein
MLDLISIFKKEIVDVLNKKNPKHTHMHTSKKKLGSIIGSYASNVDHITNFYGAKVLGWCLFILFFQLV